MNNIKLLSNVSFKTRCYRKNSDLITENENIITEYSGVINELKMAERKPPFVIGEYGFSVWNIEIGQMLDIDFNKLLKDFAVDDSYTELLNAVNNKLIDITKYRKIVFIHSIILRSDYRKRGITEEFMEFIYRDFYDKDNLIIALVKPFQYNDGEVDYLNHNFIEISKTIGEVERMEKIPAFEYFSLNDLYDKDDVESNEYRLFSVASKCGFTRLGETHIFKFSPEKTLVRMIAKIKKMNQDEMV